jgi:anti-sigma B factor antagonist
VPVAVSNFGVRLVDDEGPVTLVVWGELDRFSAQILDQHLDKLRAGPRSELEIDATGLSFCDSAGIKAIMRAYDACVQKGTTISVVGLQPAVERVFKLTGLTAPLGRNR